jgi:hypothetical protein
VLERLTRLLSWLQPFVDPRYGPFSYQFWEPTEFWLTHGAWVVGDDGETSPTPVQIRARAAAVARQTLSDQSWRELEKKGHVDVRSGRFSGLTYRLRPGRRVQLVWDSPGLALRSPWPYARYLCVNPAYSMPAIEFLAQIYVYVRDWEAEVVRVAVAQPQDDPISRVF